MSQLKELKKLIKEIVGVVPNLPIPATVKTVESETCSVELKSGLVLTDVKLKATITDADNSLLLKPKVGSAVLLLSLSGDLDNLTIIKIDEVEKIEYNQNGMQLLIDSTAPKALIKKANGIEVLIDGADDKVSIKNNTANLLDVSLQLSAAVKTLKVIIPTETSGMSGIPTPDVLTAVEAYETQIKLLLK